MLITRFPPPLRFYYNNPSLKIKHNIKYSSLFVHLFSQYLKHDDMTRGKFLFKRNELTNVWLNDICYVSRISYLCENASLIRSFAVSCKLRRALLRLQPHERIERHEVRMKFFPLKCYLCARRRRIPVGWPITKESMANNWISLVEQHRIPEGRSSRAHPEIRLPHEGATRDDTADFAAAHYPATFPVTECVSTIA